VIVDDLALERTRLATERREVMAAIDLVAGGGARRVMVAGLAHAPELVLRLSARAAAAGVTVRLVPVDAAAPGREPPTSLLVAPRPTVVA
jgi:hypothetical protein